VVRPLEWGFKSGEAPDILVKAASAPPSDIQVRPGARVEFPEERQEGGVCSQVLHDRIRVGTRTALQLKELGARESDPRLVPAEVDENGFLVLQAGHCAKTVLVMRYQITHGIYLDGSLPLGDVEGASGQGTPGTGAGWLHHLQYAP
jgi:hypothetical protein